MDAIAVVVGLGLLIVAGLVIPLWRKVRVARLNGKPALEGSIGRWHPGQFATVLVAGLIVERILFVGIDHFEEDSSGGAKLLAVLLALALGIAMLWLSWTWFGSRQKQKPE